MEVHLGNTISSWCSPNRAGLAVNAKGCAVMASAGIEGGKWHPMDPLSELCCVVSLVCDLEYLLSVCVKLVVAMREKMVNLPYFKV